ncbi:hypothetical protein [Nocardia sp. NPDC059691]
MAAFADHAALALQLADTQRRMREAVVRHAAASTVAVELQIKDDVTIEVTDNGSGVPEDNARLSGLAKLAARAETAGGSFSIANPPDDRSYNATPDFGPAAEPHVDLGPVLQGPRTLLAGLRAGHGDDGRGIRPAAAHFHRDEGIIMSDNASGRPYHAEPGESLADPYNIPGIVLFITGVAILATTLTTAGSGFTGWVTLGAAATVLCFAASVAVFWFEHERLRRLARHRSPLRAESRPNPQGRT